MRVRRHSAWIGMWAALALAIGFGWSLAQPRAEEPTPPEKLLPKDSLLYFSVDGLNDHQEAWQQTAAYKSLHESGLIDILTSSVESLKQAAAHDEEAARILAFAEELFLHLRSHGLSLAVSVTPPQNGPGGMAILILHDAAEFETRIGDAIRKATEGEIEFEQREVSGLNVTAADLPGTPGVEIGWWTDGGHLVITAGIGAVDAAASIGSRPGADLTQHRLWTKYMHADRDFEVTTRGWIDVQAIRNLVSPIPIPASDRNARPVTVGQLLEIAGLDGLNAIVGLSGFRDEAMWGETWIEAPAPRRGLLGLSDDASVSLDDLPPLPSGLTTFTAGSFDTAKFYDELTRIIREVAELAPNEEAAAQFDQFIAQIREQVGFSIREKILGSLGSTFVAWNDTNQGILAMGSGVAIQVKDADTLSQAIDDLLEFFVEQSDGQFKPRRVEKHGRTLILFNLGPLSLGQSICVDNDWLILGSPQVVESFLLRRDGVLPAWEPSPDWQQAIDAMPDRVAAITVRDPRGIVKLLAGLAPAAVSFLQIGLNESQQFPPDFEFPIRIEDIPPAELISAPLFPNVLAAEVTDEGFHYTSRASLPIPLAGAGDPSSTAVVGAVGVAVLLPAVQSARRAARRTESQNNLKQLAIAMHNHEVTFGSFPEATIPVDGLDPEEELSWVVPLLPYLEQAALWQDINQKTGWKAPDNQQAMQLVLDVLTNPDIPQPVVEIDDRTFGATHYVGLAGVGKDGPTLPVTDPRAGVFAYGRKTRIADIHDGTSNTAMFSEASSDFGPWGAGGRATIRALTQKPYINGPDGIGSSFPGGCNVGMCDGSVRFVSENIDPAVMEAIVTIRGGEVARIE